MLIRLLVMLLAVVALAANTFAQDSDSKTNHAAAVVKRLGKKQTYDLRYKLKPGDKINYLFEQVVSTQTRMGGEEEQTTSRSQTAKQWDVRNVDSLGNMTFALKWTSVNMWQQIGDDKPIVYNSKTDTEVPEEYETIADLVGETIAVFSIKKSGEVISKLSELGESNFGAGEVTIPLPDKPVSLGQRWNIPTVLNATDENHKNIRLKARISYQLTKVDKQRAFIRFRTEVLTPVKSEKVRSTIMQQMTDGYIVFDMERGYPILRRVEWDEKAQGFQGADSLLTYVGRATEKLKVTRAQANKQVGSKLSPLVAQRAKKVELRTRDAKPLTQK